MTLPSRRMPPWRSASGPFGRLPLVGEEEDVTKEVVTKEVATKEAEEVDRVVDEEGRSPPGEVVSTEEATLRTFQTIGHVQPAFPIAAHRWDEATFPPRIEILGIHHISTEDRYPAVATWIAVLVEERIIEGRCQGEGTFPRIAVLVEEIFRIIQGRYPVAAILPRIAVV